MSKVQRLSQSVSHGCSDTHVTTIQIYSRLDLKSLNSIVTENCHPPIHQLTATLSGPCTRHFVIELFHQYNIAHRFLLCYQKSDGLHVSSSYGAMLLVLTSSSREPRIIISLLLLSSNGLQQPITQYVCCDAHQRSTLWFAEDWVSGCSIAAYIYNKLLSAGRLAASQ